MGLIKVNTAPAAMAAFSMADIEHQAQATLARARSEADQILAKARQQADSMRAAATKEGHATGLAQGKKDGQKQGADQALAQGKTQALTEHRAKLATLVSSLATAAAELDVRLARVDDTVRDELIRLAMAIAHRVTKVAAAADPRVVEANVREAVRLTMDKSSIRIAIHPAQRATLNEMLPLLKANWPALKHVELIDDEAVGMGGCCVNSATGEIDAAIDKQIDRIAAELSPSPKNNCHPEGV